MHIKFLSLKGLINNLTKMKYSLTSATPVITNVINQKEINAGTQVSLECHFEGSPTPDVEWKRVKTDQRYDMSRTETVSYIGKVQYYIGNS